MTISHTPGRTPKLSGRWRLPLLLALTMAATVVPAGAAQADGWDCQPDGKTRKICSKEGKVVLCTFVSDDGNGGPPTWKCVPFIGASDADARDCEDQLNGSGGSGGDSPPSISPQAQGSVPVPMPAVVVPPLIGVSGRCMASYVVTVAKDPTRLTTLRMEYGDGTFPETRTVPQGTGSIDFSFSHDFTGSDGVFVQKATVVETGAYGEAITVHPVSHIVGASDGLISSCG